MAKRSTYQVWADERGAPAERLAAFERWVFREMAERLEWPEDEAARRRMLGQCRAFVLAAVADLGRHGYLFRPKPLAALIVEKLDEIGKMQRDGRVQNLYPYFRAIWKEWVGRNSEDLRELSMSLGTHVSQIAAGVETVPAIVERYHQETIKEQRARAARKRRREQEEKRQGRFL